MSLELLNEEINNIGKKKEINTPEEFIDISTLVIPFSTIFEKLTPSDIYTGNEIIPFEKRDPEFRLILIYEFENALEEFKKSTIKKITKT
ncbi:MAG: hypothetical protein ACFE9T_10620 [Promethearchaeota archaeon]